MSDTENNIDQDKAVTAEELTIRKPAERTESVGAAHPEGAADDPEEAGKSQFVPVGGPRSGSREVGGTEDAGIDPAEEIPGG